MSDGIELYNVKFYRKFSTCLWKNRRLMLGEMEFSKDFISDDIGNKYPIIFSVGDTAEKIECGKLCFSDGKTARLLGHLSPFACYEVKIDSLNGLCGFLFSNPEVQTEIYMTSDENGRIIVNCKSGKNEERVYCEELLNCKTAFSVQHRNSFFDVYLTVNGFTRFITTFTVNGFENSNNEFFFLNTSVGVLYGGDGSITGASFYMDSGISQADIRPVKYENGDVITENGKMFFNASVRLQAGGYQGVFSWIPGTEEFELVGALFFDTGDGCWCSDVATSLVFDRKTSKWLLWVCSFSHGHILGRASFEGEPRFGKNVVDIELINLLEDNDDDTVFGGKKGDEDPDLTFDETAGIWRLAVCRISSENGRYRYHFFESESPLDNFRYTGRGVIGSETGGSFIRFGGKLYFVCGNSFEERSDYRVYDFEDLSTPHCIICDYPDGGFRGWGSVFTVNAAARKKLYWLTFDRHNGSEFNWSYGNLYCFEGLIR